MKPLRLYVSVDAEGMPWTPSKHMLSPGTPLYNELRKIMTYITNIVVRELYDAGVESVVVADSHGSMVNLDPFKLDKRVWLIRGYPRPLAMIVGSKGADGAIFLGYHASQQARGVLGHTYAGKVVQRVRVYGSDAASEYLLNTYALGELGVPVVMVAGDSSLGEQVREFTPWAVFVALKDPVAFYADMTKPAHVVEEELRRGVREAVKRLAAGEAKPLKPREPWIIAEFKRPSHADLAELFPCVERVDGVTVRLKCGSYIENYKLFEGIVAAAYGLEK